MLVADASVIVSVVADRGDLGTQARARLRHSRLAAPDHMRIEVASVLRRHLRAGVLSDLEATDALDALMSLPIDVFPTRHFIRRAWQLRDNVTAYDACYVALAESLGAVLLTADARLAGAAGVGCDIEVLA